MIDEAPKTIFMSQGYPLYVAVGRPWYHIPPVDGNGIRKALTGDERMWAYIDDASVSDSELQLGAVEHVIGWEIHEGSFSPICVTTSSARGPEADLVFDTDPRKATSKAIDKARKVRDNARSFCNSHGWKWNAR